MRGLWQFCLRLTNRRISSALMMTGDARIAARVETSNARACDVEHVDVPPPVLFRGHASSDFNARRFTSTYQPIVQCCSMRSLDMSVSINELASRLLTLRKPIFHAARSRHKIV